MILYTKTVCPKCMLVKQLFNSAGVEYTTVNVEEENDEAKKALQTIKNEGFMALPVALYDGKYIADVKEIQTLIPEVLESQAQEKTQ